MTLEEVSWVAAIFAVVLALVGFPIVVRQLRVARQQQQDAIRLSSTQVLLAVDAVLATHSDIAAKLGPGGCWHRSRDHPVGAELRLVEPYLGVFERIFVAYQAGQADPALIDHLYCYRLYNIWDNQSIVRNKLQDTELKELWKYAIALTYVLESLDAGVLASLGTGKRFPNHTDEYFPQELFTTDQLKSLNIASRE